LDRAAPEIVVCVRTPIVKTPFRGGKLEQNSQIGNGNEFPRKLPRAGAKKVLIYRLGSLGDTVVALPCFHLVARTFPDAKRLLLTNFPVHAKAPASAAVLGDSGLVNGYMRYTAGTRNPGELLRLAWEIRSFRPDVVIYLMPVRPLRHVQRDRVFFRLAGVKQTLGWPDEEGLKHRLDRTSGLYEREASRLARTISVLGDAQVENIANWDLHLSRAERQAAASSLGVLIQFPLIVCGPGTKMQAKDWGQENWRALIAHLQKTHSEYGLVFVGAKEEAQMADFIAQDWIGPKVNLCGQLTPRETAAVLERAKVFLGPDSGPMHLAASVGAPCVICFSAAGIPGVWFPIGNHHQIIYHRTSCHGCRLTICIDEARRCLTSIGVQEVAAAVTKVLDGPDHPPSLDLLQAYLDRSHSQGEHSEC
jgi:heptosyltransferase III